MSFERTRNQLVENYPEPKPRSTPFLGAYDSPPQATKGYRSKALKVMTLDLSVARAGQEFKVAGAMLLYRHSTNVSDLVQITNPDAGDDLVPWRPGDGLVGWPFSRLLVTNAAIAGAVATFVYSLVYPDEDVRVV